MRDGLHLSWVSGAPAGTWYQVYVNRGLAWSGKARTTVIPNPGSASRIDIGTVGTGESRVDFSASLPVAPSNRALLSWTGGTFLDSTGGRDVQGFRVYGSTTPAGFGSDGFGAGGFGTGLSTVNYATPLIDIPAYTNGIITDGFGMGGFGAGGFGMGSASYSWTSGPLAGGLWTYAVAAYDRSGAIGTVGTINQTILAPPKAPAAYGDGSRLRCSLAGFGVGGFGGDGFGFNGFGSGPFGGGLGFGQSEITLNWNASA